MTAQAESRAITMHKPESLEGRTSLAGAVERVKTVNSNIPKEKRERGSVSEESIRASMAAVNILLLEARDALTDLPPEEQKRVAEQIKQTITVLLVCDKKSHFTSDSEDTRGINAPLLAALNTFLEQIFAAKVSLKGSEASLVKQRLDVLMSTLENQVLLLLKLGQTLQLEPGGITAQALTTDAQRESTVPATIVKTEAAKPTVETEIPKIQVESSRPYFSGGELWISLNRVYAVPFTEFIKNAQRVSNQNKNRYPIAIMLQEVLPQAPGVQLLLDQSTYDSMISFSWTKDAQVVGESTAQTVSIDAQQVLWTDVLRQLEQATNQDIVQLRAPIVGKTPTRYLIVRLSPQIVRQLFASYARVERSQVVQVAQVTPVVPHENKPVMQPEAKLVRTIKPENSTAPTLVPPPVETPPAPPVTSTERTAEKEQEEAVYIVNKIEELSDGRTVRFNGDPNFEFGINYLNTIDRVREIPARHILTLQVETRTTPPRTYRLEVNYAVWRDFKDMAYRKRIEEGSGTEQRVQQLVITKVEVPWMQNPKRIALITQENRPIPFFPEELVGCTFTPEGTDGSRGTVQLIPNAHNQFPARAVMRLAKADWEKIDALIPQPLVVDEKTIKIEGVYVYLNGVRFRKARLDEAQRDPIVANRLLVTLRSDASPKPYRVEISQREWVKIVLPDGAAVHGEKAPEIPKPVATVGSYAMKGRRPYMEDATLIAGGVLQQNDTLYGVFDGHGGSLVAELAQQQLPTICKTVASSESDIQAVLRRSLLDLNNTIALDRKLNNMGATAAVVYIGNGLLYSANLGDARTIVDIGKNKAKRVSKDHKADDPEEISGINALGGTVTPGIPGVDVARVNGNLAVARALGDRGMGNLISADAYLATHKIETINQCAITACDGIWDVIPDDDAVRIVQEVKRKKGTEREAAQKLVQIAYDRGSSDNLSAVVTYLN